MKNIMTRLISLFLITATLALSCALLFSCNNGGNSSSKQEMITVVENGATEYSFVYQDNTDEATKQKILALHQKINEVCCCEMNLVADTAENSSKDTKEILVGNTSRDETKDVLKTLEKNGWAVVHKENKIVICAENDAFLELAIDWFVENCINVQNQTVEITKSLENIQNIGDGLVLRVDKKSDYQIVYPKGNKNLEYYASLLKRKLGINKVVPDNANVQECEIVIGNTNRAEAKSFSGKNEYSISTNGSKVFISASNEDVLYYAVNYYIEYGVNIGDRFSVAKANYNENSELEKYYAEAGSNWGVNLPYAEAGEIANVFDIGAGLANDAGGETLTNSYMHIVSNIQISAFEKYAQKLESFGFKKIYASKTDQNDLWGYRLGAAYAYLHYAPNENRMRVIWDKSSNCEISDIDLPAEQVGTTTLYQYSLNAFGLLYIVKLQDNSLILVDSGSHKDHWSKDPLNGICDFLYEITGNDEKTPIHVRMWYITHPDGDHFGAVAPLIELFESRGLPKPKIDTFAFNFPGARSNTEISNHGRPVSLLDCINKKYPDSNYIKLHTGMVFNVGEVKVEMLGTIENIVLLKKQLSYIEPSWDTNDTCSMARFTFGKRSVLLMGDIRANVEDMHLGLYSKEYIKSDIYQVPHHGYNLLYKTVEYCDPEYVLISNSKETLSEQPNKYNYYTSLVPKSRYHFAGDYTTALAVTGGEIKVTKIPRYDDPSRKT